MLDFEIRAVNSRRAGPLLYLACRVVPSTADIPFEEEWKSSSADMERVDIVGKSSQRVNLVFATSNFGRGTANVARFDIGIPIPWQVERSPHGLDVGAHWVARSGLQYSVGNQVTVFWTPDKCHEIPYPYRNKRISEQTVSWQQVIYSGNETPGHPIWPTSGRMIIGVLKLERQNNGNVTSFLWLPWRAFADDMMETRGAVLLKENANKLYVFNYDGDEVWWWYAAEGEQKFEELKQIFQVP